MGTFVTADDIGSAWLRAYEHVEPAGEVINLAVSITNPLQEDLGVRNVIEERLVKAGLSDAQSMHTVANTIFPISLYRPGSPDAAQRFMLNAVNGQSARHGSKARWGTYIGRLVDYPTRKGARVNQLNEVLQRLNRGKPHFDDAYEIPIAVPTGAEPDDLVWDQESADRLPVVTGALLHADIATDGQTRGGPCLAHISLTAADRRLSMVAVYRRHAYEVRAYGNFLGLARLLAFLAHESDHRVGELMVVTGHAVRELKREDSKPLLKAALENVGTSSPVETSARPRGSSYKDLALPGMS